MKKRFPKFEKNARGHFVTFFCWKARTERFLLPEHLTSALLIWKTLVTKFIFTLWLKSSKTFTYIFKLWQKFQSLNFFRHPFAREARGLGREAPG